ncbi:hypothetical protein [Natribacillus halophilus]|uniref:Uncharacterized protein n=1 Tax=Natribacillus halophilus TaxID=549003 RepID=A0A1G8JY53_9BACI|nr:hypothetical protein [Natribacillus halophilus]SDI36142.1 hypothetical protein SAMN04488123_101452 [Natribacillus halophilus]
MTHYPRVDSFVELYHLIELFSIKRDLPVDKDTEDFFERFEEHCEKLDLDVEEMKKRFQLYKLPGH